MVNPTEHPIGRVEIQIESVFHEHGSEYDKVQTREKVKSQEVLHGVYFQRHFLALQNVDCSEQRGYER